MPASACVCLRHARLDRASWPLLGLRVSGFSSFSTIIVHLRARRSCLWCPSVAISAGSPGLFPAASPSLLPLAALCGLLRGLARAFPCREPVAPASGGPLRPPSRARPGVFPPRAGCPFVWCPSATISAGSRPVMTSAGQLPLSSVGCFVGGGGRWDIECVFGPYYAFCGYGKVVLAGETDIECA